MVIVFRADSSVTIGTGHIMRCLTLAEKIREKGAQILFICRDLPGNICNIIELQGYNVFHLPYYQKHKVHSNDEYSQWLGESWEKDSEQIINIINQIGQVDWLIIDHYSIEKNWEIRLRPYVHKIMVIDDLANRIHECDLLLDQNFYENMGTRYLYLVPDYCMKFLGPKYALLRSEFENARKSLKQRDGIINRILVFFGGSDPSNETLKTLQAIKELNQADIAFDIIVGATNPCKEEIGIFCNLVSNTTFHYQVNNMAQLIANADLGIGAGGSTTWERCFLGLPSITIVIAKNQEETTMAVAASSAIWNLGRNEDVTVNDILKAICYALNNPLKVKQMGRKALELVGGMAFQGKDAIAKAIYGVDY